MFHRHSLIAKDEAQRPRNSEHHREKQSNLHHQRCSSVRRIMATDETFSVPSGLLAFRLADVAGGGGYGGSLSSMSTCVGPAPRERLTLGHGRFDENTNSLTRLRRSTADDPLFVLMP